MKEVTMPSGAKLRIDLAPFKDARALQQAMFEELRGITIADEQQITSVQLIKDLFCTGFSSKKIEAALDKCMARVLYNGLKIDENTWEPADARQDYMQACVEVAKENLAPFVKSLYAEFARIFPTILSDLASRPATTP